MAVESTPQSLTEFSKNAAKVVRRVSKTRRPQAVTQKGVTSVFVVDARSYAELCEAADRKEMIEALRPAIASMREGKGTPLHTVAERVRKRGRALAARSRRQAG